MILTNKNPYVLCKHIYRSIYHEPQWVVVTSPRVAQPVAGGWETGRVSSIELNVNDITNYVVRRISGYSE